MLVLVARVEDRGVSSKAAPVGFGPPNPTGEKPSHLDLPNFPGEWGRAPLQTKHALLGLGQETRFSPSSPAALGIITAPSTPGHRGLGGLGPRPLLLESCSEALE